MSRVSTICRRGDFRRLYAHGRRFKARLMTLVMLENLELSQTRPAFVVSAKVGNAVVRTKLRRRLREAWRLAAPRLAMPADVAIIVHRSAVAANYAELANALYMGLRRAGILPEEQ